MADLSHEFPSPPQLPIEGVTSPVGSFEPTPEGFGAALDATLALHESAVQYIEPARGDTMGMTGGEQLTLYTNPRRPRETIIISPVGSTADDRRFPATQGMHFNYNSQNVTDGGTYRIYGGPGNRSVQQWGAHPDLESAVEASYPEEAKYASLIEALSRASIERPAGRSQKVVHALGNLSRRRSAES